MRPLRFSSSGRRRQPVGEVLEARQLLAANPWISEFMARNQDTLDDGDGVASDWIELYNAGDEAIDLAGWHLTDDARAPAKWTFPAPTMLQPGEFLVVFASGQSDADARDAAGNLHATFRLSAVGEYLALTDPGLVVHQQFSPAFPPQVTDVSYGWAMPELQSAGYLDVATPGAPNSGTVHSGVTEAQVVVSQPSGVFSSPQSISLASDPPGLDIYYTLDGSVPDRSSPRYSQPIAVNQTTQIRTRVIEPDKVMGPTRTASYLRLGDDVVNFDSQLPIMVIDNFGAGTIPNSGWNQTNAGIQQVARQPANLMLFEPVGQRSQFTPVADVSTRIGIRVRGAFSSSFQEPGYSVETWNDAADTDVDVPLAGIAADSDWVLYAPNPAYDETLIDNSYLFALSNQMGQWAPDVRYVETFVNVDGGDVTMDDFVGLYVITEKVKRTDDRLAFERLAADGSSGGWLLDINRMDPISVEGIPPRNFHTAGPNGVLQTARDLSNSSSVGDDIPRQYNAYINFDDPNGYTITQAQRDAIEGWFQTMEDVLYGRVPGVAWDDPVEGYAKYIDVDSFIDYYILNEISLNGDGLLLSMWLYNPDPKGGGKLQFGPIWDADLGSFSGAPAGELMRRTSELWYGRLFDDPNFVQRHADRWQQFRRTVLSDENMHQLIDDFFGQIGDQAAMRDGVRNWPTRLSRMKDWLAARATAIDALFVAPPEFNRPGGTVPPGSEVTMAAPRGDIYYTTDGSDPRLPGGDVSPTAQTIQVALSPLVTSPAAAAAIIPDATIQQQIGDTWTSTAFVEGQAGETWVRGGTGVGYDNGTAYDPLIETDLGDVDRSVYIRIPFELPAELPADFDQLLLKIQYDDGFVAYLNGREVARANVDGDLGVPVPFDARANSSHRALPEEFDEFPIGDASLLRPGTNVLAIHGFNVTAGSSDLLIRPELYGSQIVSAPIRVEGPLRIIARALSGARWSGPNEVTFDVVDPGDLNADGQVTAADMDLVCAAIMAQDTSFDLTADGKIDLDDATFAVQVLMKTNFGDANFDGVFGSSDLVLVLQGGEYEDGIAGNSTWADGDWNCDGEFNSADLVFALQMGGYQG